MEMFIPGFTQNAGDIAAWGELLFGFRVDCAVGSGHIAISEHNLTEAQLVQLEAVLRAAKPFSLRVNKTRIVAGGEDYATVTVESVGDSIVLLVRDQEVEVELVDGVGTLEVSATVPTVEPITVRAKDQLVYGFAQVEVRAI